MKVFTYGFLWMYAQCSIHIPCHWIIQIHEFDCIYALYIYLYLEIVSDLLLLFLTCLPCYSTISCIQLCFCWRLFRSRVFFGNAGGQVDSQTCFRLRIWDLWHVEAKNSYSSPGCLGNIWQTTCKNGRWRGWRNGKSGCLLRHARKKERQSMDLDATNLTAL